MGPNVPARRPEAELRAPRDRWPALINHRCPHDENENDSRDYRGQRLRRKPGLGAHPTAAVMRATTGERVARLAQLFRERHVGDRERGADQHVGVPAQPRSGGELAAEGERRASPFTACSACIFSRSLMRAMNLYRSPSGSTSRPRALIQSAKLAGGTPCAPEGCAAAARA